jgi:hypothetical protein
MLAALSCLQEPLLTLLLQHKWEKFARTQVLRYREQDCSSSALGLQL